MSNYIINLKISFKYISLASLFLTRSDHSHLNDGSLLCPLVIPEIVDKVLALFLSLYYTVLQTECLVDTVAQLLGCKSSSVNQSQRLPILDQNEIRISLEALERVVPLILGRIRNSLNDLAAVQVEDLHVRTVESTNQETLVWQQVDAPNTLSLQIVLEFKEFETLLSLLDLNRLEAAFVCKTDGVLVWGWKLGYVKNGLR